MHSHLFLHRSIKPKNIAIGLDKKANIIHLTGMDLSKLYIDPATKKHIPFRANKKLTAKMRYSSVNSYLGIEQSRRDDLESLAYILIYFLRGNHIVFRYGSRAAVCHVKTG